MSCVVEESTEQGKRGSLDKKTNKQRDQQQDKEAIELAAPANHESSKTMGSKLEEVPSQTPK